MPTSGASSSVKHLDFYNPDHPIKVETDSFSSPRPKSMIPGAKRQSYENFTEQFQKRRRKNVPSPARSQPGLGSPKAGPASSQVNYKAMTHAKIEIINEGIKFLSKNKKPSWLSLFGQNLKIAKGQFWKHQTITSTSSCHILMKSFAKLLTQPVPRA